MTTNMILKIDGMECANCALRLDMIETALDGITRAEASFHKSQLALEFNENEVGLPQIEAAVQRLGFTVVEVN
jgi:Cu+-exporting ATPase